MLSTTLLARCLVVALASGARHQPHLVLVLADDLGWGNVGWHRAPATAEVQTPVLDRMVSEGVELNRFYAYHMCSPTRSALQSGRHPLHVNIVNADPTIYNASEATGVGAGIPRNMTGLASKLRGAGYATHFVGKWDAGMATPTHTPHGRGYNSGLGYFHHGNSYWNEQTGDMTCSVGVDLYDTHGPARGLNGTTGHQDLRNISAYEEHVFMQRVLEVVGAHDPAAAPLFLMYSAHLVHDPYQVPQQYLDRFSRAGGGPFDNTTAQDTMRMTYAAMTYYLDENVGRLRAALEARGMWNDTLLLFIAEYVRVLTARARTYLSSVCAAGGAVAPAARGTRAEGLASVADVYTSFCALAGADARDTLAESAGLPAVDGLDLSPVLLGTGASPRAEVPLMPLTRSDLQRLDAHDAAAAAATAAATAAAGAGGMACTKRQGWAYTDANLTSVDGVLLNACCDVCNATPGCAVAVWEEWANASGAAHRNGTCYVKGTAAAPVQVGGHVTAWLYGNVPVPTPPPTPAPAPTPPTPPAPPAPKPGKCGKQQGIDYADANLTAVGGRLMNDCCGLCAAAPGCAASVWYKWANASGDPHGLGTCFLKTGRAQPVLGHNAAAFLPAGVPVPPPVITSQAGIVVGDLKLVTGIDVNMAVFTGPAYPNSSTPYNNSVKVPGFACSLPAGNKVGCLFNVSADPTEHRDLALEPAHADDVQRLLARLRAASATRFDPARGSGDPAACAQMEQNGNFFGPWLP
eukprot:g6826.t1